MDSTGPDRARVRDDLLIEAEASLSARQQDPLSDRQPGSSKKGKRKRGRLKHVLRNAKRRVRVSQSRVTLASFLAAHQYQFPSEPRLIQAAGGKPLQSQRCQCNRCLGRIQGWPVGYRWLSSELSYECGLHAQSEWYLQSLPSSSSIVRFG
jgi:hypothetical protein